MATLLAEEVHISDVDRTLQKDAVAKGMKIVSSILPAIQHMWFFGGLYFATPDKLDPKVPFVKKEVRQAMNMAINRTAIANALLGGRVQPLRIMGYHPQLSAALYDRQWAAKMREIGLQPSSTGEEGGKETGQSMSHYIIPDGR